MTDQDKPTRNDASNSDTIYRAPASDTSFTPKGDLLAAYVGPKNSEYYARHFARFKTQGNAASWNWPAFFLTSLWLLYRKMWLFALVYWIVLPIVLIILSLIVGQIAGEATSDIFYNGSYFFIALVLAPMFATRIYFEHAQNKVGKVVATTSSAEQQSAELARIGGTSKIVLIVMPFILVAVVGILAAIAIPAYQDYTVRAQVSEGLHLSGTAKAAVAEHYQSTGELAANNEIAGLLPARRLSGNYVSSVTVGAGNIVVTYGNQAHDMINGKTLVMTPETQSDDLMTWSCSSASIEPKHLPAACR